MKTLKGDISNDIIYPITYVHNVKYEETTLDNIINDLASKQYVDEKIIESSNGEISLENYYSKNEINELVVSKDNMNSEIDNRVKQLADGTIYGWNIVYGTASTNINANSFVVYFNLNGENKSQKWLHEHGYCYRIDGWGHKGLMYGYEEIGPGDISGNDQIKLFDQNNDSTSGINLKTLAKNEDLSKYAVVRLQLKLNKTSPLYPAACVQYFHNPLTKHLWMGIKPSENISDVGTLYFHNGGNDITIENISNLVVQADGFNRYTENTQNGVTKENSTQYFTYLSDLSNKNVTYLQIGKLDAWQYLKDYDIIRFQLKTGNVGICETFYHNSNPYHVSKHYVDNLISGYESRIAELESKVEQLISINNAE